jgi:hypothetical protein
MKCARSGCSQTAPLGQKYCTRTCAPFSALSNREEKKERKFKNLTDDEIKQFQKRAAYVARKQGYPQFAEDFAQEVLLAFSSGRTATVDQLFVDYLRKEQGSSRTPGGRARQMARARTLSLDEPANEEGSSVLNHELVGDPGGDRGPLQLSGPSAFLFSGVELDIYQMVFVEERTLLDVGDHLGVSESRVCQRVKEMQKRMREHYLHERLLERYRDDSSFGILEVEWVAL